MAYGLGCSEWPEKYVKTTEENKIKADMINCDHIGIVSISKTKCQCMDCLQIWEKRENFKSDWPEQDRG